jgi:type I restriction enzyme, S subunit
MSWEEIELKEISEYRTEKISTTLIETNYISTENMLPEKGGITDSSYPPTSKTVSSFKTNDVLVSNIRPYFKKIWFADFDGGCSNDVIVFKSNDDNLIPKFLYYQLSKDEFFDFMMSGANGTKMPRGNRKAIPKFKLLLPPLHTQRRIADILSAYDDLIENNLKRIKLLEQAAQNIYKEWFVKLRFPGYENTPIIEETGLPEGWEKQSAFNLFDIKGGTQPPKPEWADDLKEGYVRMVQIRDYKTDSHIAYVKDTQKLRRCDRQDVMIARYGASVGRICWGLKGAYNVALVKVVPYDNAYLEYIRWYVKSYYFQESLVSMTQRAAQDGFNKDTFKSLDAIIPAIKVVNDFHNMVYPMLKQMELLKNKNQKLKAARDILLPRLMNRTIEV